jgi:hypothetical protein
MTLQELCDRIANPETIYVNHSEEVPDYLVEPLNVLVKQMRLKVKKAETIEVIYLQNQFDDMSRVYHILDEHYDGDVNDALATVLSKRLYGVDFNNLNQKEMNIIKVLTIYLMILPYVNEE